MNNFRINCPFEARPPRLKDLVNNYVMGEVWVRDSPFGPVTDSLIIAEKFKIKHSNVLRAIQKMQGRTNAKLNLPIKEPFDTKFLLCWSERKTKVRAQI